MPVQSAAFLTFNRGIISRLGLARLDLARGRLSAQTMRNWMPRVLGSMMLRPGLQYLGSTHSDAAARFIPFVFAVDDKALIELTASVMRIWVDDAVVSRPTVTTAVTNGGFDTNVASWTDNDEAGGVSDWVSGGYLGLTGNGSAAAIRSQQVTVSAPNQGVEHGLRVVVARGPVTLRVGSTAGGDEYVNETDLQTGTHSLAFTPTGDFHVRFLSRLKRQVLVDSCTVDAAGAMTLPTPWAAADLGKIRFDQSADVIFAACVGYTQRRLERRAARSWSVVQYLPPDGPFRVENTGPITLTPGALSGNTTLTASASLFRSTNAPSANNAGSLFRVTSSGQRVTASVTAENVFTSAILVTGTGTQRPFTVIRSGTWVATVTLQRSLESADGPWVDVTTYTTNGTVSFDDGLSNQDAHYRIGVKTGGFTSGTVELELNYSGGSITGVCRVTAFTSSTVVSVEVISDFGATTATDNWAEGEWSDRRGWPSAVAFHEGRLGWGGKGKFILSESDAFDAFDPDTEGDSAAINRSIGSGPVDTLGWMTSLERLIGGGQGAVWSARSSSLDEPLTPTNFNLKTTATFGAATVDPLKIDRRAIYVEKSGVRVVELSMANDPTAIDYGAVDLTQLAPEIGEPAIVRTAVQRQPDTRLHFVRSDGVAAVLLFDVTENTLCWLEIESDGASGLIEDVVVLPGEALEDDVYYVVRRTINGATKRYLEKWAQESAARGGAGNRIGDSFSVYSGAAATAITGLSHLEGQQVSVWADGADVGTATSTAASWTHTYTVSGGQITLAAAASIVCVGLPYRAQWKSGKLAIGAALGTPLTKKKRLTGFGEILADTHAQGLLYGRSFEKMDPLPLMREGAPVSAGAVLEDAEDGALGFPGDWSTDSRLCLEARSPRPCTIVACVADAELHEQR